VVRADLADDAVLLHGVVSRDGEAALFCWARLATSAAGQSGRVQFPGLAADTGYRVRIRGEQPSMHQTAPPAWAAQALAGWADIPGAVLTVAGLPMPTLNPEQAMLIEVRAAGRS
jgi:alpha-galactosidase